MVDIPNIKVAHICMSCMTPFPPNMSNTEGNCLCCMADNWLEERDFEHNPEVIDKLRREKGIGKSTLKILFELECVGIGTGYIMFKQPTTGSCRSMPASTPI